MKKSIRPSGGSRPVSRPSIHRSTGVGGFGSSKKAPFQQTKKEAFGGNQPFAGPPDNFKKGPSYLPGQRRARSGWTIPLIVLAVLFVCCLLVLCIGGVYLFSQGLISIPSFQ